MLPRETDADMRRDGSRTAQSVKIPPSMSAEECTAHQDSMSGPISPQAARTRSRRADGSSPSSIKGIQYPPGERHDNAPQNVPD